MGVAEALSTVTRGGELAREFSRPPAWYWPVIGASVALLVVGVTSDSGIIRTGTLLVFLLITQIASRAYKRATGTYVGGLKGVSSVIVSLAFLLILFATVIGAWALSSNIDQIWPIWVLGALAFVETLVYGRLLERAVGDRNVAITK